MRGGGLITLIKDDITFTNINILNAINTHNTDPLLIKIHIGKTNSSKHIPSIKIHYVTTLQHRGHIHRILYTTHWDHKHNTHTINGLTNKTQPKKQNNNFKDKTFTSPTQIANTFHKQFTNTFKHKTHKTADNQNNIHHNTSPSGNKTK